MELKGKRLLILGGAQISCEIVRHARALGITTAVTDWYPYEKSPAKQIADEAYYESTSDMTAMEKLIVEKNFDGVITGFTDSVLPYYAEMCKITGLPAYGTREQFETFINKEKYKELMRKFDVPTIPEYRIDHCSATAMSSTIRKGNFRCRLAILILLPCSPHFYVIRLRRWRICSDPSAYVTE